MRRKFAVCTAQLILPVKSQRLRLYRIFTGISVRKRTVERSRRRWEDNIKMYPEKTTPVFQRN